MPRQNPEIATPHMQLVQGQRAASDRQALCRRSVPPYAIFFLTLAAGHMRYIFP